MSNLFEAASAASASSAKSPTSAARYTTRMGKQCEAASTSAVEAASPASAAQLVPRGRYRGVRSHRVGHGRRPSCQVPGSRASHSVPFSA